MKPSLLHLLNRDAIAVILLFSVTFGVYISSRKTAPVSDSRWSIYIAMSIIKEHNTDLDEYREVVASMGYYDVDATSPDGHIRSLFPLGAPLMAVPAVYCIDIVLNVISHWDLNAAMKASYDPIVVIIELLIASLICSLSCIVMYAIFRQYADITHATLMTLIFAFCTSLWSTASRALWQHGPSILMLALALWLIVNARKKPWMIILVAIPLSFSYIVRPTNSIAIIFLSLYVFIEYRKYLLGYLAVSSVIASIFIIHSFSVYGSILPPYYSLSRVGYGSMFVEALCGNLVSPSRGLMIYSPIMILIFYGIYQRLKKGEDILLLYIVVCIIVFHWIVISTFPHWWGGHCYGPRFFTDMIPYLMFLMVPFFQSIEDSAKHPGFTMRRTILVVLSAFSLFIQFRGAVDLDAAIYWNGGFDPFFQQIDKEPRRLWDWSDPQFMRGLRPSKVTTAMDTVVAIVGEGDRDPYILIPVGNIGDRETDITIRTMGSVSLLSSSDSLVTLLGMDRFDLIVMTPVKGLSPGRHRRGSVMIRPKDNRWFSHRSEPIVVPIILDIRSKHNS